MKAPVTGGFEIDPELVYKLHQKDGEEHQTGDSADGTGA